MSVAAILRPRINKLSAMELRKWPRRNDAESIDARREAIRGVVGDEPLAHDDEAWTRAQESHTGAAVIPVAVVGPLLVELGSYELEEPAGDAARDRPRAGGAPRPARAHRGRPLGVDVARAEGGRDVRRLQNIRPARQNDSSIMLYLQEHRGCRATCKVARRRRSTTSAPSSRRSTTRRSRSGRSCAR